MNDTFCCASPNQYDTFLREFPIIKSHSLYMNDSWYIYYFFTYNFSMEISTIVNFDVRNHSVNIAGDEGFQAESQAFVRERASRFCQSSRGYTGFANLPGGIQILSSFHIFTLEISIQSMGSLQTTLCVKRIQNK